jgi:hypothetical protein
LAPNDTLTIKAGEKVSVEAVLLDKVDALCTWFTATSDKNTKSNCSTILAIPPGIKHDTLTVLVQPACGTSQESASLHIDIQP